VSSDSDEILAVATNAGAKPIRRPSALATDAASSESALEHALQEIEKEDPEEIDYVVFLQATSPVRHPHDIDRALQVIVDEGADSLMSACPSLDFFLWGKTKSGLASLNYDYRNRKRRQDLETTYLENGSIYVFKPEMFRRERNRLGGKICVYEMDKNHSNQIDEPEDLDFCEYLLKKYYP
jgi:N-acylneuraminate cytidylyltransferase